MKAMLCSSGGKDCLLALDVVRRDPAVEVVGILTTISGAYDRVTMHGVRRELMEEQAAALGLPIEWVVLPAPPADSDGRSSGFVSNETYNELMRDAMLSARARGVEAMIFGDLLLEDVRSYREQRLAEAGMKGMFPLWGSDTNSLVRDALARGLCAVTVCVDASRLDRSFAGRALDAGFLEALPDGVDPCGERGEFHTFVTDGPGFSAPVRVETGDVVQRDGFWFADLIPVSG